MVLNTYEKFNKLVFTNTIWITKDIFFRKFKKLLKECVLYSITRKLDCARKDCLAIESKLPRNALVTFDKGAKSKGNCELIRAGGRDYLSAIKDTTELREKIRRVDKDSDGGLIQL
jgi:hypothetical protein